MAMKSLDDLFLHTLKDIYYAERKILKTLPKMAKAAESEELKQAFLQHRDETQGQVERLQQVFEHLGKRAQGVTCEAMDGLVAEAEELLDEAPEPSVVRDAGLLSSAQTVEHYEIARYGTLIAWAKAAGHTEVVQLLQLTLDEEKNTDKLLNQIANQNINKQAARKAA